MWNFELDAKRGCKLAGLVLSCADKLTGILLFLGLNDFESAIVLVVANFLGDDFVSVGFCNDFVSLLPKNQMLNKNFKAELS